MKRTWLYVALYLLALICAILPMRPGKASSRQATPGHNQPIVAAPIR